MENYPYLLVALGGMAGALARFGSGKLASLWLSAPQAFWGTLAINGLGSFVLGFLVAVLPRSSAWLLLLGTGFCGGFTTFSTFSVEVLTLLQGGRWGAALGYAVASLLGGLAAAAAGYGLAELGSMKPPSGT